MSGTIQNGNIFKDLFLYARGEKLNSLVGIGLDRARDYENPEIVWRFNLGSPLANIWKGDQEGSKKWRVQDITSYLGVYVLGMMGFALELPFRVIECVVTLFKLMAEGVIGLVKRDGKRVYDRALVLGITTAKIVTATLGMLCPPAAHKINAALDKRAPSIYEALFLIQRNINTQTVRSAYAQLGLPFGASEEQVTAQYRVLARRFHPDREEGGAVQMRKFNNAKDRLDPYFEAECPTDLCDRTWMWLLEKPDVQE